ncbi:MAG: UbiA family prenyltransferase [Candidatus Competibacter sp.]|nr:UbiA family prenyltransferase [Candidatus Competibacter sp.]MDG4605210.1 UbiA family prenyltransferase [Candidatus Contendobacter sp.]HRD49858.1 UbiA family prenyltransferase [Candidatus Contendobacter sp.]
MTASNATPVLEDVGGHQNDTIPLYVDLDGTLVKSDLLVEGAIRLLRCNLGYLFALLFWLAGGKARLKAEIARRVEIDPAELPFHQSLLNVLRAEAARGRPLFLASASNLRHVQAIADHIALFDGVLTSDDTRNLAGPRKLDAILAHCNGQPFDYAGNARPDLSIWRQARCAIVVNPEPGVEAAARRCCTVEQVLDDRARGPKVYLRAIRIHQWLKNLLLAVPLLTSHTWGDWQTISAVLVAFIAFGLCASASYLLNDLIDLPADRSHPRKAKRPLAAGDISPPQAIRLMVGLLAAGLGLTALLPTGFLATLVFYLAVTVSYSLHFKAFMLLDVLCLAGLYTLRIIAGAEVIGVEVSNWLLAFSMFVFLSLALVKRCAELITMQQQAQTATRGRDYRVADYPAFATMGIASGYLAVMVLTLFIDSPATTAHYVHPRWLWLLCPLMLYWISRLWIKTVRGEMHDDPLVYSLQDRASWILFAAMAAITFAAT